MDVDFGRCRSLNYVQGLGVLQIRVDEFVRIANSPPFMHGESGARAISQNPNTQARFMDQR